MSPLYTDRVAAALSAKGTAFEGAQKEIREDLKQLQAALAAFAELPLSEVKARIGDLLRPGAKPTTEQDSHPLVVKFGQDWANHQQARAWAQEVLAGVPTFAADGSQIFPSRDMSVQVGLVQIGWFENAHDAQGTYEKDVAVEVLAGDDLNRPPYEPGFAEREIEWRRFAGEVDRILAFVEAHAGQRAVAFLDGTYILSFIRDMTPKRREAYIAKVQTVLARSEESGVPVVGFVDSSNTVDLVSLLSHLFEYKGSRISDANLMRRHMDWGDRSRMFVCSRDDGVADDFVSTAYYEDVVFTYVQTSRSTPPARVELPKWVFEQGLHDWVLDVVRAECVVGVGYPYPLETADAVAVLSMQDRERFYRLFQEFAESRGIKVRFSRKSLSKRGRRV